MTDDTISKLLRLKRYEQPSPAYFENFLHEFHRRQRAEILRRPLWRQTLDRFGLVLESLMGRMTLSQLSYAGASAAVLAIAGVMTWNLIQNPGATTPTLALNGGISKETIVLSQSAPGAATVVAVAPVRLLDAPAESVREFTLDPQMRFLDADRIQPVNAGVASRHPRYILDARPVSYEPPFSF